MVGALIFFGAGKGKSRSKPAVPGVSTVQPAEIGDLRGSIGGTGGPVTLTSKSSQLGSFVAITIVAAVWNGMAWGILLFSKMPGGGKFFVGIFCLIGLAIAAGAVHQFLSLFNPRPTLQASSGAVRLGDKLDVNYQFSGNTNRMKRMRLTFRGEEAATYRRGTNTTTDRHTFFEQVLLDTTEPGQMRSGSAKVEVPSDLIHTFTASNNKIVWTLKLHGEIPRWPDVSMEFEINVLPHPIART
jgi:hypothetical protein